MRIAIVSIAALGLLAACGSNDEERAATGALSGAGAGALVGGPVGAVAGAAIGGVGGTALDEGVDKKAERAIDEAKNNDNTTASGTTGQKRSASGSSADRPSKADIRKAQTALKSKGLYNDKVDGIMGPHTRDALRQFQAREGLQQTARLDRETRQRLMANTATGTSSAPTGNNAAGSGTATTNGAAANRGAPTTGTSSGVTSGTSSGATMGTGAATTGTSNTTGAAGDMSGGAAANRGAPTTGTGASGTGATSTTTGTSTTR